MSRLTGVLLKPAGMLGAVRLEFEFTNGKAPREYAWYESLSFASRATPAQIAADLRTLATMVEDHGKKITP